MNFLFQNFYSLIDDDIENVPLQPLEMHDVSPTKIKFSKNKYKSTKEKQKLKQQTNEVNEVFNLNVFRLFVLLKFRFTFS